MKIIKKKLYIMACACKNKKPATATNQPQRPASPTSRGVRKSGMVEKRIIR